MEKIIQLKKEIPGEMLTQFSYYLKNHGKYLASRCGSNGNPEIVCKFDNEMDFLATMKDDNTIKTSEIAKLITHETPELESKPKIIEKKTIKHPHRSRAAYRKKEIKYSPDKLIKLRSTYEKISDSQIESLPFMTIDEKINNIFLCHSSIYHRYELKILAEGNVVIDHTTKLMWHQSGSTEYFNLRKANKWLKKTNKKSYAGFNDWRLPTLEEASTILEVETKNGNFTHTVFDDKQWGTWTGDKPDRGTAWIVTYVNGTINHVKTGEPATFVRPVRSLNVRLD
ncbi:MAG: DUF1566 domain-containing protein [Candidatus Brocadiales bacterium]|nr:DUF1566 domain-containing protein [Candidatus Brocadiales bacterium]